MTCVMFLSFQVRTMDGMTPSIVTLAVSTNLQKAGDVGEPWRKYCVWNLTRQFLSHLEECDRRFVQKGCIDEIGAHHPSKICRPAHNACTAHILMQHAIDATL